MKIVMLELMECPDSGKQHENKSSMSGSILYYYLNILHTYETTDGNRNV